MANDFILFNKKDHIGYITLNRMRENNQFDFEMAQKLAETCIRINGDEDIYLIVISGDGGVFCTGGNIRELLNSDSNSELPSVPSPAEAIAGIDRPTIAAINGDAIGEGLELALACDLRIAADKARFGLPQITDGSIPLDGGTQRLPRVVGKGKALEMVLSGEIIDAREAFEIGLVNKIVSSDGLSQEIESLAHTLAGKAPLAMRYAKEAVNQGLDLTLEQGLRLEADLYFLLHTTADRTEGIRSFLQKRKPDYKGG